MKNTLFDLETFSFFIAQAESSSGWMDTMLVMLLFIGGMYFLLIAPQRRKQKKHEKMLAELQVGEKVLTNGGIYGIISQVKKPDRFVIKIADNTKVEIHRNFIQNKLDAKQNGQTNENPSPDSADSLKQKK